MATATLTFGRMRNVVQIIHLAMCAGVAAFAVVAWMLMGKLEANKDMPAGVLVTVGAVLSMAAVAVSLGLPVLAQKYLAGRPLEVRLRSVVFARVLVAASLEAAALFWTVVALLHLQDPIVLGAAGLCLGILLIAFPTQVKLEEAIGTSEELADRELAARRPA